MFIRFIFRFHLTSLSATWIWPKDTPKARHQTSRVLMSNTVGLSSGSRSTMSSRGRNLCRLTCGSRLDLSKEISSQDKKEILVLNPFAVTMTFISLPHNSLHSVPDALCWAVELTMAKYSSKKRKVILTFMGSLKKYLEFSMIGWWCKQCQCRLP